MQRTPRLTTCAQHGLLSTTTRANVRVAPVGITTGATGQSLLVAGVNHLFYAQVDAHPPGTNARAVGYRSAPQASAPSYTPYGVRIDPTRGRGPMAIDTAGFSGIKTAAGGVSKFRASGAPGVTGTVKRSARLTGSMIEQGLS